jgi:hypothetical protein
MWDEPATSESAPPPPPKKKDNTGLYLLIGGGVAAGIGYGLGLEAMVSGIASQSDSSKCGMQPMLSLIPLFGPLAYMASMPPHNIYGSGIGRPEIYSCDKGGRGLTTGFAVSSEILQIGGAATAITGFVLMRSDPAKPPATTSSVVLHPGTAGAPLGLTMTITTF